ncbi:hypothetical protein [Actinomadura decatromicini]|uniref:hypothetical protein n=1 Tax=Actinomadura decatromicini TaxID=2604572 RepID=UPI001652FAC8|nr:hypothetical protein [Actinomadura decatromicini]
MLGGKSSAMGPALDRKADGKSCSQDSSGERRDHQPFNRLHEIVTDYSIDEFAKSRVIPRRQNDVIFRVVLAGHAVRACLSGMYDV